jgi:hypothetical protein
VLVRCEAAINNNWGAGGPGEAIGVDDFSVRWTGQITFSAGYYTFIARTDDGMRLRVDGVSIVDAWQLQGVTEYRANLQLGAGVHAVVVEYYENGGSAVAQVSWVAAPAPTPTRTPTVVPTATLAAGQCRVPNLVGDATSGFISEAQWSWWMQGFGTYVIEHDDGDNVVRSQSLIAGTAASCSNATITVHDHL